MKDPLEPDLYDLRLSFDWRGCWQDLPWTQQDGGCLEAAHELGVMARLHLQPEQEWTAYRLEIDSPFPTRARLRLSLKTGGEVFHLIPANIHGDNALAESEAGHFPNLTDVPHESPLASPLWEFRADRAPCPISALCYDGGAVAITVEPYSDCGENRRGYIANGLLAELPATCGISLGYGNEPVTFINKETFGPASCHKTRRAVCQGRIYQFEGDRRVIHTAIRREYELRRECPVPKKTPETAAHALVEAFVKINYVPEWKTYSNQSAPHQARRAFPDVFVPADSEVRRTYSNESLRRGDDIGLLPWRPLLEIGWTGGGVLAFPFIRAEQQLNLPENFFPESGSGQKLLDAIAASRNPESGWLFDLTRPWINGTPPFDRVNGWWTFYPLCRDMHCAYTQGSAVYYLIKSALARRAAGQPVPPAWIQAALGTLDTALALQREDGNFGFSYAVDRPLVLDWNGFAGCWLAAASALAWQWDRQDKYLQAAQQALPFYHTFVCELSCRGTPMDTWKSVDEEGNLAFIKLARHLYEATGAVAALAAAVDSANYEMLWRYGYRTRPPAPPLNEADWNSCGGSLTSVSNPHAHPMALIATGELLWLAEATGDRYWHDRAEDAVMWTMKCMELYPEVSGYGAYGVLTERFCPSDGLLIEKYDDGTPSSLWFSYNGWAAGAALEGILEWMNWKTRT